MSKTPVVKKTRTWVEFPMSYYEWYVDQWRQEETYLAWMDRRTIYFGDYITDEGENPRLIEELELRFSILDRIYVRLDNAEVGFRTALKNVGTFEKIDANRIEFKTDCGQRFRIDIPVLAAILNELEGV